MFLFVFTLFLSVVIVFFCLPDTSVYSLHLRLSISIFVCFQLACCDDLVGVEANFAGQNKTSQTLETCNRVRPVITLTGTERCSASFQREMKFPATPMLSLSCCSCVTKGVMVRLFSPSIVFYLSCHS